MTEFQQAVAAVLLSLQSGELLMARILHGYVRKPGHKGEWVSDLSLLGY